MEPFGIRTKGKNMPHVKRASWSHPWHGIPHWRQAPVIAAVLVAAMGACAGPPSAPTPTGATLAAAESLYADLREVRDRIDVSAAAPRTTAPDGIPLAALSTRHNELRGALATRLSAADSAALRHDDARALGTMRRTLERDIAPLADTSAAGSGSPQPQPDCAYDPRAYLDAPNGLDSLRDRLYACYGWAQHHVVVGVDTLDRLSVLGSLGHTEDPQHRRQLFLALDPVWRTINGDNDPNSPYRQLIALEMKRRGSGEPPAVRQARASGVLPDSLER